MSTSLPNKVQSPLQDSGYPACDIRLMADCMPCIGPIFANKKMLCDACPEFAKIFETQTGVVDGMDCKLYIVNGINGPSLKAIVEFIYKGSIYIDINNVQSLIVGAARLYVTSVVFRCISVISGSLNVENCLYYRHFAKLNNIDYLYWTIDTFIKANFDQMFVIGGKNFEEFSLEEMQTYVSHPDRPRTNISEEVMMDKIITWVKVDKCRSNLIEHLMTKLDLALVPFESLITKFKTEPVLALNAKCQEFYIRALENIVDKVTPDLDKAVDVSSAKTIAIDAEAKLRFTRRRGVTKIPQAPKDSDWINRKSTVRRTDMNTGKSIETNRMHFKFLSSKKSAENSLMRLSDTYSRPLVIFSTATKKRRNDIFGFDLKVMKCVGIGETWSRRLFSSIVARRGILYDLGGASPQGTSSTTKIYNTNVRQAFPLWEAGPSMKFPRADFATVVYHDAIFAIGGLTTGSAVTDSMEKMDVFEGYVRTKWDELSPMPQPRYCCFAAVLNNEIVVVGGCGFNKEVLRSAIIYNESKNAWREITPMSHPRNGVRVTVLNNKLYAVGGCGTDNSYLKSVEVYTADTNEWKPIADMNHPRKGAGVITFEEKIFVVGGNKGENTAEVYDPATDTWKMLGDLPSRIKEVFFHSVGIWD